MDPYSSSFALSIILIIILLLLSALVSGAETAFFAIDKTTQNLLENDESARSKRVLKLLGNHQNLLITILITNNLINIIIAIKYLLTTCFSPEFGIFYFSAIIFSSFYFLFHYLLNKRFYEFLFLTFFYIIPFLPILIFENHGTSYGFRYLFTLAPLNLVIYLLFYKY